MKTNFIHRSIISLVAMTIVILLTFFALTAPVRAIEYRDYDEPVARCQELQDRLSQKTQEFTQKRQDHLDKYSHISGLFSSVTSALTAADYNTDLMTELQPGLDRRIVHFTEISQVFLAEMQDVTDSACRDKASLKQELDEARLSLGEVQKSVAGIQEYIQNILIVSVQKTINEGPEI